MCVENVSEIYFASIMDLNSERFLCLICRKLNSLSDAMTSRTLEHMTMLVHVRMRVRVSGSVEVLVLPLGGVPLVTGGGAGVLLHTPGGVLELLLRVLHEAWLGVEGWRLLDRRLLEGLVLRVRRR